MNLSKKLPNSSSYIIALLISLGLFFIMPSLVLVPMVLSSTIVSNDVLNIILDFTNTGVITDEFYTLNIIADTIGKGLLIIIAIILLRRMFVYDLKDFALNYKRYLKLILISSIVMYIATVFVNSIYMFFGIEDSGENQELIETMLLGDGKYYMIVSTILIAPIIEELIFRKLMIGTLEETFRLKKMVAILIATFIFAFIHVMGGGIQNYIFIFQYLPLAFIMTYAYCKANNNIFVSITIHFINNALSIVLFYIGLMYGQI